MRKLTEDQQERRRIYAKWYRENFPDKARLSQLKAQKHNCLSCTALIKKKFKYCEWCIKNGYGTTRKKNHT